MGKHSQIQLDTLTDAEKRALGEALISSANTDASAAPLSAQHLEEIDARLTEFRANPGQPTMTLTQLRASTKKKPGFVR